ncbi:MAG TPA: class I SAM-dependent methyltransferase [Planctomycetes bacterium]|nr:class I SAM-dependent methyltransferase [Planctomycetota bacterium]
MHTKISPDNPYRYNRWGFAWEYVPAGTGPHLDFGCNKGEFLNKLKDKKVGRLVGVDVSEEAVKQGRRLFPELEIIKIREATSLPFDDAAFDSITILDVLEHVYEQNELLKELNRILKRQGKLIVTVPGRHVFSFLDMGNFKFRFPGLHKWYYCLKHSHKEYEYRYASNPDGLVGDISVKKRWHEHFGRKKLEKILTEAGFSIIDFDGSGFFHRLISNISYFIRWWKSANKAFARLQNLDAKFFESAALFCIAEKKEMPH